MRLLCVHVTCVRLCVGGCSCGWEALDLGQSLRSDQKGFFSLAGSCHPAGLAPANPALPEVSRGLPLVQD